MDALVLVGGCDKTVPAQLMAAASATVPATCVVTGPMMTGSWRGQRLGTCTDFALRSSTHLAFGEGPMDWQAVLNTLLDGGYTRWLDIDLWEHPDPFAGAQMGKRVLDEFLSQREVT